MNGHPVSPEPNPNALMFVSLNFPGDPLSVT
jgi:hypothetical protein